MSEKDLSISDMKKMQLELYEKHNANMRRDYEKDNKGKYNKKTF